MQILSYPHPSFLFKFILNPTEQIPIIKNHLDIIMNCKLQLRGIILQEPIDANRQFFLSVTISEKYHARTIEHRCVNKRIPICEDIEVDLGEETQLYAQVDICEVVGGTQNLIDSKIFYSLEPQALGKHQFQIPHHTHKITATLDCLLYINHTRVTEENRNLLGRIDRFGKRLKQQIHDIKEQTPISNLEIIRIGEQTFHFTNRLDNLIRLRLVLVAYRDWVNPPVTLALTYFLTMMIFSPRVSIIAMLAVALFFRETVLTLLVSLTSNLQFPEKRLIIPPQNLLFLKEFIDKYCGVFDYVKGMIVDPEKVELRVTLAKCLSKAWIPIVVLGMFSVQEILVIGLWGYILNRHNRASEMVRSIMRIVTHLSGRVEARLLSGKPKTSIVSSNPNPSLQGIQQQTIKVLFVYQYERQWFGIFNSKDAKITDESGQVKMGKEKFPHPDYEWIGEWKVVVDTETDPQGSQIPQGQESVGCFKETEVGKKLQTQGRGTSQSREPKRRAGLQKPSLGMNAPCNDDSLTSPI